MMNIKLLSVVTPPSINHGWSTRKTFWEEKFTAEEKFTLGEFSAVNMKTCGSCNVRKHKYIKGSDRYVTLDISFKFDSLEKMKITSSEPKNNLVRAGKGLITFLDLRAKVSETKYKKAKYAIINVSKKDLSTIIREFEELRYESYERRRFNHEPTDIYCYLARQLEKCIMRADALNSNN